MNYLFVANWKMNMSTNSAIDFCNTNYNDLCALPANKNCTLIICPSFVVLPQIISILKTSSIKIGAQNCSEHQQGSYTGDVSAQSLAEIGITYCIIGHSEQRIYHHETDTNVAQKIILLIKNNIQPIICIGETKTEFLSKKTETILMKQLHPIITALHNCTNKIPVITIAYEPVWSIGTGIIPEQDYLENIFSWLKKFTKKHLPHQKITTIYGGSVDTNNASQLKKIPSLEGFLIGKASTDFTQLKAIVSNH